MDRAAAESAVEPLDNRQNDLRKMLGLPLDGGTIEAQSAIWRHRMPLDGTLKCGETRSEGKFGCEKPAAK